MKIRINPDAKEKACTRCKVVKPCTSEHFNTNNANPDGLACACKICTHKGAKRKKKRVKIPEGARTFHRLYVDAKFWGFRLRVRPEDGDEVTLYRSASSAIWGDSRPDHDDAIKISPPGSFVGR